MKETVETRAVRIAARVMQAAGLCRYESPMQCRRIYTDDRTCEKCIRDWLMAKARKEMKKEESYGQRELKIAGF